jgi:hypothetical protein
MGADNRLSGSGEIKSRVFPVASGGYRKLGKVKGIGGMNPEIKTPYSGGGSGLVWKVGI